MLYSMQLTDEEKQQKRTAVIDVLACDFARNVIRDGMRNLLLYYKAKAKTKHDYPQKRDMRYMKSSEKVPEIDYSVLEEGGTSKYSALGIQSYMSPYLLGYEKSAFHDGMKLIHHTFSSFRTLASIDLSGQLIGLAGMKELVAHIDRCPVQVLSLTNNSLDDASLELLSTVIRSMGSLEVLHLSHNRFTDVGVEALLDHKKYSSSLKLLNLSRNTLTTRSAYFLGMMFSEQRKSAKLDSLVLGGSPNSRSFGDDFLRVLFYFISAPNARALVNLGYADSGIDIAGICCVASILCCCPTITSLNIARNNLIVSPACKKVLELALSISPSLIDLYIGNCGLSEYHRNVLFESFRSKSTRRPKLTWHENTLILSVVANEMYNAKNIERRMAKIIFNEWRAVHIPRPSNPQDLDLIAVCALGVDEDTAVLALDIIDVKNPPSDIPRVIRSAVVALFEVIKWCIHIRKSLNRLYSTTNRPISSSVLKREESATTSLKLCFSNIQLFRTANKKTRRRKYASATASLGVGQLQMLIEETHSYYLEYSVIIEMTIGSINRDMILIGPEDKERNSMSFFKLDLLEGYYTHYYYFAEPIDKSREDAAVIAAEKAERLRRLEEERERKKGGKKKKKNAALFTTVNALADISATSIVQHEKQGNNGDTTDHTFIEETDNIDTLDEARVSTTTEDKPNFHKASNITKYIWRLKVMDTLRKRDDPLEMPFSLPGRATRSKLVINRKYPLDKGDDDSSSVFLNSFVELERSIQMPRISRFNFFRHTAHIEEKFIARLEDRVKATEDENK